MRKSCLSILFFELYFICFACGGSTCKKQNSNSEVSIEAIVGRFDHSEGPHWDYHTQTLLFVDISAQRICKFNPRTESLGCTFIANGPVGVVIPVEGEPHKLVAGSGTDFVLVSYDNQMNTNKSTVQVLAVVDIDRRGTRWNDGKADSLGRFWGGTIGSEVNNIVAPNEASFYVIDHHLKPEKKISPVTNSNGLAWNLKNDKLYYIDTPTLQVASYNFNLFDGTISNKEIVFDLQKHNISGLPDGMTIDTDGNLWVALYNGGGVINVDPHNDKVIRFLPLPVKKVTSCTFGGPLLDTLFVTTSSRDLTKQELAEQPYAGYIFAIKGLGVHGSRANAFRL